MIYYIAHKDTKEGVELIEIKELKDTIGLMNDKDYRNRFRGEYFQLKIRYEKLKDFCNRIETTRLLNIVEPKHDCPYYLLREQQNQMGELLHTLEIRAIAEGIDF